MKKVLTFVIFLLTLFPLCDISGVATVKGQRLNYENGEGFFSDLYVDSTNEKCDICGRLYDPDEGHTCKFQCECCQQWFEDLDYHLKYDLACKNCQGGKDNDPPIDGMCYFCSQPIDYCTCSGGIGIGNRPGSGGGSGGSTGGGSGSSTSGSSGFDVQGGLVTPTLTPHKDTLKIGDYYTSDSCKKLFRDSVMVLPLQTSKKDCVSTNLAYAVMWLKDFPVEKFDSVKNSIEDKFKTEYDKELTITGVADTIVEEFIQMHSGVNAIPVYLPQLREMMQAGRSGLGTLMFKNKNEAEEGKYWGHEISIIGYDECEKKYICKDSQKMELVYYGEDALCGYKEYNQETGKNLNLLFYIEKDYEIIHDTGNHSVGEQQNDTIQ